LYNSVVVRSLNGTSRLSGSLHNGKRVFGRRRVEAYGLSVAAARSGVGTVEKALLDDHFTRIGMQGQQRRGPLGIPMWSRSSL